MKKETIIWQLIVFVLGALFILTLRGYFIDKNVIAARTNSTNCRINVYQNIEADADRLYYFGQCSSIENFNE